MGPYPYAIDNLSYKPYKIFNLIYIYFSAHPTQFTCGSILVKMGTNMGGGPTSVSNNNTTLHLYSAKYQLKVRWRIQYTTIWE